MSEANARRTRTLVLLALVVAAPSTGALAALWLWPGPLGSGVYLAAKCVLYGIPAVIAWRTVTRQNLLDGLRRGLGRGALLFGLLSGLLISGVILGAWFWVLSGRVDVGALLAVVREAGMDDPIRYWLFAAWLCIGNSLLEEFVFRWFVDGRLSQLGLPRGLMLPISALIFTAHHVLVLAAYFSPGMVVLGSVGVFIGGLVWSWTLLRWNSLLPGWISHALVDVAVLVVGASILGLNG